MAKSVKDRFLGIYSLLGQQSFTNVKDIYESIDIWNLTQSHFDDYLSSVGINDITIQGNVTINKKLKRIIIFGIQ